MSIPEVDPVFSAGVDRPVIGFDAESELVERAALLQIMRQLDEEVDFEERVWEDRDKHMAEASGRSYERIVIERVEKDSFHQGSRPSLLEQPPVRWPFVTARCNDGAPAATQFDQFDTFDLTLIVEVLCKAGPYEPDPDGGGLPDTVEHIGEDLVNKRTQRLTGAVMRCIRRDPSLGGLILAIQRPPRITPSIVWTKRGEDGKGSDGPYYYFQGKQLEYVVQKHVE